MSAERFTPQADIIQEETNMKLRYRCLVLDHDDTTVRSTPDIHYPQWLETLRLMRPGVTMSLYEFMQYNFDLGFFNMCRDVMHFTKDETDKQYTMWKTYMLSHTAPFYEGMAEIITDYKKAGGIICISTHSNKHNIIADYEAQGVPAPDRIYDYTMGEDKIKPSPYALVDIMESYGFKPEEILTVDDMKSGFDMANEVGVPFACAGWSHIVPKIREYMKQNCDVYLQTTGELRRLLFEDD